MEIAKILKEETPITPSESVSTDGKPTQEDIIDFYDKCIMQRKRFMKTYHIGKMPVVLRTRKGKEVTQVFSKLSELKTSGIDSVRLLNDCNLAFSLYSMNNENYDKGTLEERLEVLDEFDSTLKATLWDMMSTFNLYVEELRKVHVNF
jgi:hypothetical protein